MNFKNYFPHIQNNKCAHVKLTASKFTLELLFSFQANNFLFCTILMGAFCSMIITYQIFYLFTYHGTQWLSSLQLFNLVLWLT